MTRPARYAFLEHDGLLAFAHRGGAVDYPENTLAAFQAAVDLGYQYLETDAYATRDGVLLSFHDDRLDRVTDREGAIEELDYASVKQARISGTEPIPLLEDLIAAFPDTRFNIDPKHDACVEPLIEAIKRTGALERVCVGSFSGKRVARVREALGPKLCTSLGPWETAKLRFSSWGLLRGRFEEFGCAQIPVKQGGVTLADSAFIRRAHKAGLQVHIWTIDEPDEMNRLIDLGVDGIMTDRPSILRSVLEARDLWA